MNEKKGSMKERMNEKKGWMKRKEGWKDGRIKERMNEKNKIFNAMMIERMNECWPEPPSPTPASMCPVQSRNPLHPGVHYPEASLRKLNPFGTTEKKNHHLLHKLYQLKYQSTKLSANLPSF